MAELLAPAGSAEALQAAVQNGADAVYLGGTLFGARHSAQNFADLGEAVAYCHLRGVRVYLTLNTLVKDQEFPSLYEMIDQAAQSGVDACIVQDIAVAKAVAAAVPGLPLHASTQMGVSGKYGARWAAENGFSRVIAARECSIEAIEEMSGQIPTEVFVHGALCTGYSGQCLFSSMIGARSGNRGRCAQPCRLPYTLAGKQAYCLSPRDLGLLQDIPRLIQAGVCALKIEGRLRRPEYVALATAAYRRALDAALEGRENPNADKDLDRLFRVFNRGAFTRGYAFGFENRDILNPERPNHAGVLVGKTGRVGATLTEALHKGDLIEARPSGESATLEEDIAAGSHPLINMPPSQELFRTVDARLMEEARDSYARERRLVKFDAKLTLEVGSRARLRIGDVEVKGPVVQAAQNRPMTANEARAHIRFDQRPWRLGEFEVEGEGGFLPVSSLNAMRREACDQLEKKWLTEARLYPYAPAAVPMEEQPPARERTRPMLILQSYSVPKLLEAKDEADALYYQSEDWNDKPLDEALETLGGAAHLVLPFWLEGENLRRAVELSRGRVQGYVAGHPGQLALLSGQVVTDASMHAFSSKAVAAWIGQGADRVTLSPEMTMQEMRAAASYGPCEAIVHGRLLLMTLRHCPLRARERAEGACADCVNGHMLADRKGEVFPLRSVKASDGCRVNLYNGHVLCGLEEMQALGNAGCAALRILGDVEDLRAYRAALSGESHEGYIPPERHTKGHWRRGVE